MDQGQWIRKLAISLCIVHCALCIGGCSIPAIESADCTAARDVTKRYYSLAVGGDLAHQPDALAQINKLRAPGFSVSGADGSGGRDAYNFSLITPSSSRVDECSDLGNG